MADLVILDTLAQAQYFADTFNVPPSKLRVLYVGCDEEMFRPRDIPLATPPTILFYGTFLPLHGLDVIVRAAHQMAGEHVHFQIIGTGLEYEHIRALARQLRVSNIEFLDPMPIAQLPNLIARATICLGGHFGRSDKARRVIAGKTFQCMASGKPTIVGENLANRELFTHGENVWMCTMNDPLALTEAIRYLLDSPQLRARLGENGRELVLRTCGNAATAQRVISIVEDALSIYRVMPNAAS